MSSEDLIKNLANNLKPVKKQSSPNVFAFKYLVVLVLMMIAGVFLLRVRNDFFTEVRNITFLVDTFFNFLVLLSGIFITGWFSTAGRVYNFTYKFVMMALFVAILFFNAYRLSLTTIYFKTLAVNTFDMNCFSIVMALSLISTITMILAVSKRVVLRPGLVGAIIGMLSFSVGSLVIGIHCPISSDEHVTLYHTILPMLSGTFIGFLSGKVFLKL